MWPLIVDGQVKPTPVAIVGFEKAESWWKTQGSVTGFAFAS